jgi:hypothetical protein
LLLGLHAVRAYDFRTIMNPLRSAATIVAVCGLVFMVLLALAFAFKISSAISRLWAFSWMLSLVLLILTFRAIAGTVTRRLAEAGRIGRRIMIYGAGLQGQRLVDRIEQLDEPWNRIVGVFDDRLARTGPMLGRFPVLGNLADLVEWGRRQCPDEILVAIPWGAEERLVDILQTLAVLPANVRLCSEFHRVDLIQGRANSQYGITMLNAFEKPQAGWGRIWKRCFRSRCRRPGKPGFAAADAVDCRRHQARERRAGAVPAEALRLQQQAHRDLQVPHDVCAVRGPAGHPADRKRRPARDPLRRPAAPLEPR